ncbi:MULTISPECIES: DUF6236 family protein [Amycolatopsis]|uniref:Uncharacterized protein n=1 Tax=Amycolatopsis dendrobii TaxID=2760662 RepID=A0A7W3W2K8_9PSEU|nr:MULTISPECIES: DUF6236 family protein [Amycolatopsis]MBB1157177.1 hypothetical protein [Amycolatopsis dendrobii]UKD59432.1 DUF6236 family protein [Amycolatopsis sp. FU40]
MPSLALYYPWTHVQNDNWLKLALLTWDRLARMRPPGAEDRDGDLVRRLRAETDFLVETAPSAAVLDVVAESFGEIFDVDPGRLLDRFGLDEPRTFHGDLRGPGWRGYAPPITQHVVTGPPPVEVLTAVPVDGPGAKMTSTLRDGLLGIGLAVPMDGPWVGLDPKLASIYLAVLADAMSRREALSPVTDDPRMHHATGALDRLVSLVFDEHVPLPAVENVSGAYLQIALETVLEPSHVDRVPVEKLIRFRETHRAGLAAFQAHVASLGPELQAVAAVENLEVAAAHLRALYETRTRPQLDELRKALRGMGIEASAGTLVQKIDLNVAAGTVLGSVAAAGGQLAVAGAAVAVTLVPYLAGKAKARRQQVTKSPVAYLLAADRKLTGRALLRRDR